MSFCFRYIRQYSQKKQKTKYFLYYLLCSGKYVREM
jgi:hypothetical protein